MSDLSSQRSSTESAAQALRAAFTKRPEVTGVEIVRAPGNESTRLNDAPINNLLLPGGISHDGDESAGVSPEMARVQHHVNARHGASLGGRHHGNKTYESARAACEPKKK